MLTKLATFRGVSPSGEPLVRLFEPHSPLIKEAGTLMPQIKEWMSSYKPQDGKLALLVNAMGSSEYWGQNVNGDVFPEAALIHDCRNHKDQQHQYDEHTGKVIPPYGYWTFLQAYPFVHHRNKDPSRAFGHVALAVWNPRMHRVELIVIIDKALALMHGASDVVDRVMAGEFPDVSMGCRVPYDVCTICSNKSKTRNDYCSCVKDIGMGKILEDGRRIGVINCHPRFFDISFVFIGADKTAKVMCKLASGLVVPQSVAEADLLYGENSDYPEDGLLKSASVEKAAWEVQDYHERDGKIFSRADTNRSDIADSWKTNGRVVTTDPSLENQWTYENEVTDPTELESARQSLADREAYHQQSVRGRQVQSAGIGSGMALGGMVGTAAGSALGKRLAPGPLKAILPAAGAVLGGAGGGVLAHKAMNALGVGKPPKIASKKNKSNWKDIRDGALAGASGGALTVGLSSLLGSKGRVTRDVLKSVLRAAGENALAGGAGAGIVTALNKHSSIETGDVEDARFPDTKVERKKLEEAVIDRVMGRTEAGVELDEKTAGLKDLKSLKGLFTGEAAKHVKARIGKRSVRVDKLLKTSADETDPTDEADTRLLMGRIDNQESASVVGDGLLRTNMGPGDEEESMNVDRGSQRERIHNFYVEKARGGNPTPPGNVEQRSKVMGYYANKPTPANIWTSDHADSANLSKEAFDLEKAKKGLDDRRTGLSTTFERAKAIKIGPPPSPNRKEYPFVGTIEFKGLTIHVENKPGDIRRGKKGTTWQTEMKLPYGEILGTRGADGDKLDVYVGPWRDAENAYIVHQNFVGGAKDGNYDEDKVMLGFDSAEQAKAAYLAHYSKPGFFRSITAMAFPLFKKAILRKEAHGEKLASAWGHVTAALVMEDEFKTKEARQMTFKNFEEAARAAAEYNYKIPSDWVDVLGLVPRLDEMSGHYFLSYRPLSSQRMREVFGDLVTKEGHVKTAASLEDLFAGAGTARRRERVFRDEVTGKEERVLGSGINKTASVDISTVKVARVLHGGWSPEDLLKVSNETKAAAHLKWADIVKRIGPSKAVGRVTPLLSQTEPDIPNDILNKLGAEKDLKKSLATPALMGMALKPREFQRIILIHIGRPDVADKMDAKGEVFKPSEKETAPCESLDPGHLDEHLLQTLLPFLEGKSYTGPVVRRRIVRIIAIKPTSHRASTEVDSPLLSKVASAYTWYRRESMKLARAIPATVTSHPELHARTLGVGAEDLFSKTAGGDIGGLDRRSLGILLGSVPLSLLYSAHKRQQMEHGEDVGLLGALIAEHPWLTSMGAVTGLGALLRDPRAQQAVDEAFSAGDRIWRGKQVPANA